MLRVLTGTSPNHTPFVSGTTSKITLMAEVSALPNKTKHPSQLLGATTQFRMR